MAPREQPTDRRGRHVALLTILDRYAGPKVMMEYGAQAL